MVKHTPTDVEELEQRILTEKEQSKKARDVVTHSISHMQTQRRNDGNKSQNLR